MDSTTKKYKCLLPTDGYHEGDIIELSDEEFAGMNANEPEPRFALLEDQTEEVTPAGDKTPTGEEPTPESTPETTPESVEGAEDGAQTDAETTSSAVDATEKTDDHEPVNEALASTEDDKEASENAQPEATPENAG